MSRYLIVGGVAGGATAAARIRRLDEKAEIVMFERGEYISFANCGLPYHIGGIIRERERLLVTTAASFRQRYRIDVRPGSEVVAIDRAGKKVRVREAATGREYDESYDKLILSPGAEPVRPDIPGMDMDRIFTLRNIPDTDRIRRYVDANRPRHAVVIGGGFIGVEMTENLAHRGVAVTLVDAAEQVMLTLDYEMAADLHNHLRSKGVGLVLKDGVKSFAESGGNLTVELMSGRVIKTDMVIMSIGVRPESRLAHDAGLELAQNGAIAVDEFMRTSDRSIYAVGDAVAMEHPVLKRKISTFLAGPANKQARIAADNMVLGDVRRYRGAIGTSIAKVFDMTVASTGLSERVLAAEGIKFYSSVTHASSHAGYYPGAMPMTVKLVYSPEGKIYGAQVTGYDGVDARIDMIASVMGMNGTVYDLGEVEHAYAPPFSSAKDPVNAAAFTAENIVRGLVKAVSWRDIGTEPGSYILDVRTRQEFSMGSIPGSVNIPVDELREYLDRLPRDRKIIITCAAGLRGYLASRVLTQNGFDDVWNLSGGYRTWYAATSEQRHAASGEVIGSDDMIYPKADCHGRC